MNEEHFWKIFPAEFHDYLLKKKWFWKSGHDSEGFLENFSRQISSIPTQEKMLKKIVWKNFPEILLSHHPKIVNFNFYFKSCILEKFSKNSPVSRPKILKMAFGNIFQKTSWFTTRIFRCDQFWTQIFEKGYLRGLLWYHVQVHQPATYWCYMTYSNFRPWWRHKRVKTFFWKNFPENPLTHAPIICQYGLRMACTLDLVVWWNRWCLSCSYYWAHGFCSHLHQLWKWLKQPHLVVENLSFVQGS